MGDRIVTWPNALSAARLIGVPVFLWLVIVPQTATADLIAAGILGLAGLTDWLDGKLARIRKTGSHQPGAWGFRARGFIQLLRT